MKRKQRKPATPRGRTRGIPHMIYLSEDESAKFRAKAAARGRTLSDQVRFWVNQESRRKPAVAAVSGTDVDPRQISIEDIAPPEGQALEQWAEREGMNHLLQQEKVS